METLTSQTKRYLMLRGCEYITQRLKKKGQITIPGFGKFYLSAVNVNVDAFNPTRLRNSGETKSTFAIRFRPSAKLKKVING